MKKWLRFLFLALFISVFAVQAGQAQEITEPEKTALEQALQDEYKAREMYKDVVADFGDIRPFSNIVHAEQRHVNALLSLFEFYQVSVPENASAGTVFEFTSVKEACQAAVDAEIENAGLYDELLLKIEKEDIKTVFNHLQNASLMRHLRAFRRCVNNY